MRDDDRTDLPGWLGLRQVPDLTTMRWQRLVVVTLAALFVAGLFIELLLLIVKLFVLAVSAALSLLAQGGGSDASAGSLGRGAVIVAVISAPFVIWRSVVAQKTVNVTEQGHITDRINTAVQGLGSEKTVKVREFVPKYQTVGRKKKKDSDGNPIPALRGDGTPQGRWDVSEETQANLEVRIGAIYALERIAQDSKRDHVQIMEILCAYIRQNAPAPNIDEWTRMQEIECEHVQEMEKDWLERLRKFDEKQEQKRAELTPGEDIQVILSVLGRRKLKQRKIEKDKGYTLDLRHSDLRCMDLRELDLCGARFHHSRLDYSNLKETKLRDTILWNSSLSHAFLGKADLTGARIGPAHLQGTDLVQANLKNAFLAEAKLSANSCLEKIDLKGAALRDTDLIQAPQLYPYLDNVFGDESVKLPNHVSRPSHWSTLKLSPPEFRDQWQAWQADLENETPPGHDQTA